MNEQHPWYGLLYADGIKVCIIGVLAILALFLGVETMSVARNLGRPSSPATDTVTVSGEGEATMLPDVAHISFTVQNSGSTVAEAQAMTSKQGNDAISYIEGQGVALKDIKMLAYTIIPRYSYRACPAGALCPASGTVTGYQVSESVQVTVRDLAKLSALLEGLGSRQVQNISGPEFTLDDPAAGYDAARADAIGKAEAQAALLARELGVHLGKVINFSESTQLPAFAQVVGGASNALAKDAAPAPVVPMGENTYNASVSITYEIRS